MTDDQSPDRIPLRRRLATWRAERAFAARVAAAFPADPAALARRRIALAIHEPALARRRLRGQPAGLALAALGLVVAVTVGAIAVGAIRPSRPAGVGQIGPSQPGATVSGKDPLGQSASDLEVLLAAVKAGDQIAVARALGTYRADLVAIAAAVQTPGADVGAIGIQVRTQAAELTVVAGALPPADRAVLAAVRVELGRIEATLGDSPNPTAHDPAGRGGGNGPPSPGTSNGNGGGGGHGHPKPHPSRP